MARAKSVKSTCLPAKSMLQRRPLPHLQPYVSSLWASVPLGEHCVGPIQLEHVLPTGHMHLVFRLNDVPLRLFNCEDDRLGVELGTAVVGGARDTYYTKAMAHPNTSVGCVLKPGASLALFGIAAHEISGTHTRLDAFWGSTAEQVQGQLMLARSAQERISTLEQAIFTRVSQRHDLRLASRISLTNFDVCTPVAHWVRSSGLSHRHFNALFLNAVGLTPKRYARVQRMQQTIQRIKAEPHTPGMHIALDMGYSDQAHWCREFRAICGMTPGQYLESAPVHMNHVSLQR